MKHVLCSNGSWIDGNSSVPKQKLDLRHLFQLIWIYSSGEKSSGGNVRGEMSGYRLCPTAQAYYSLLPFILFTFGLCYCSMTFSASLSSSTFSSSFLKIIINCNNRNAITVYFVYFFLFFTL